MPAMPEVNEQTWKTFAEEVARLYLSAELSAPRSFHAAAQCR